MEQPEIFFSVAETLKNGAREVTSAPNNWFKNGVLLWPTKGVSLKRKNCVEPESDWLQFDYQILKADIRTLREALAEEKRYSLYSNSESEREAQKLKEFQRLHPVGTKNPIDANNMFDNTKTASGIDVMKNITILEEIVFDTELPEKLLQEPNADKNDLNEQIGTAIVSTQNQNEEYQPNLDIGSIVNISNAIDINKDSRSTIVSGEYQNQQNSVKHQIIPVRPVNTSGNSMPSSQYQSQQQKHEIPQSYYQHQPQQYQGQLLQYLGQPQQYLAQPQQCNIQEKHDNFKQNDYYNHQNLYHGQQNQYRNLNQNQPYVVYLNNYNRENDNIQRNHHTATFGTSTSDVVHPAVGTSNLYNINSTVHDGFAASTSVSLKYAQEGKEKINKVNHFRNIEPNTLKNNNLKKSQEPKTTNNVGKENGCKSTKAKNASTKTIRSKIVSSKLTKGKSTISKNKKQLLKSLTKSNQIAVSVKDRNTNDAAFCLPSEKAFVDNINRSTLDSINNTEDSVASIEYLPLIYKEIMAMKQFIMAEAAKRQKNDHKIAIVEQAQARSIEKLINMERVIVGEIKTLNHEVTQLTPEDRKTIDTALPKESVDLVEHFEVKLNLEPVYKNKVTSRMKKIGGKRANLMVRSVMSRLITDPVLDKYTWTGMGVGMKSFKELTNINDVVYNAVSGVFKKYTLFSYGKYMVEFLKHSSSRQRSKKSMKQNESVEGDDEGDNGRDNGSEMDDEEDGKLSDEYEEDKHEEDEENEQDEDEETEEEDDDEDEEDI